MIDKKEERSRVTPGWRLHIKNQQVQVEPMEHKKLLKWSWKKQNPTLSIKKNTNNNNRVLFEALSWRHFFYNIIDIIYLSYYLIIYLQPSLK